jgi:hypothetical protein
MADRTAVEDLRAQEYDLRQRAEALRRLAYSDVEDTDNAAAGIPTAHEAAAGLAEVEVALTAATGARLAAEKQGGAGVVVTTAGTAATLGVDSTGLEATVALRMAYIPTAVVHLLQVEDHPLVTVTVRRAQGSSDVRRVRVIAVVEGYSAPAVQTVEMATGKEQLVRLLPTFYPAALREVTELTRATLTTLIEDIDKDPPRVEIHQSASVWLLARNTAPLSVRDPAGGTRLDLTRYLGAFVTPNAPDVVGFLRKVAAHHPERRLVGYQGAPDQVEPQVRAVYETLATDAGITYVNSVVTFDPEEGSGSQRVRLPRESLNEGSANYLDASLLFASLLEAMSLRPVLVLVPGHAMVAWETWLDSAEWCHLETTVTGSEPFEVARRRGELVAQRYASHETHADLTPGSPPLYRRLPLRDLRAVDRITPME